MRVRVDRTIARLFLCCLLCEQIYDNGVAGMHIMRSNNFTFEATIGDECYGDPCTLGEGEGNVGSLDGQQPIEVIVEDSTLVTFQDMRVRSVNGEGALDPKRACVGTLAVRLRAVIR